MKQKEYSIPSVVATTLIAVGILGFFVLGTHPVPLALGLVGILIHIFKPRLAKLSMNALGEQTDFGRWYRFVPILSLMPIFVVLGLSAGLVWLAMGRLEYSLTVDSEGYGSLIFIAFIAPVSVIMLVGLALIPSVKMFRKRRRRIDLVGVILSSTLLALIVIAWIAFEPLRRHLIFDR